MTDAIDAVTADEVVVDQQRVAEQLLARRGRRAWTGLLNQLTKRVLETP